MIRFLLPLCVLFFLLFLGVVIFQMLIDRAGTLAIWNSPFWAKYKILIILAGVLVALVLLVAG